MTDQSNGKNAQNDHDSGSRSRVEENARQRMKRIVAIMDRQLRILTEQHTQSDTPNKALQSALTDFKTFFNAYGNYFDQPAITKNPKYTFHILVKALDKITPLWETLARAVSQRSNTCFDFSDDDKLAAEFLARFNSDPGCNPQKPPIIYYEKRYHITRFLFDTHPLIGIPIDMAFIKSTDSTGQQAQNPNREAIAHEMGHYFFWNNGSLMEYDQRMNDLREAITNAVLSKQTWKLKRTEVNIDAAASERLFRQHFAGLTTWLHWVDEIVADIVGTLLCGPAYALSAQDIQATSIKRATDLYSDDGEHPMPYLRPMIALKVLELTTGTDLQDDLKPLLDVLTKHWQDFRANIELHLQKPNPNDHGHGDLAQPTVTHKDLEGYLDAVVAAILDTPVFSRRTDMPNTEQQSAAYHSLRESVTPWDQAEPKVNLDTIKLAAFKPLPLLFVATEELGKKAKAAAQKPAAEQPERTIPEELRDLVQYINQRRDKLQQADTPAESEEWEDLLDLELSRNLGHLDQGLSNLCAWATHSHSIKHYHYKDGGSWYIRPASILPGS